MPPSRRHLLWLVAALAVLAAITLWEVFGTVLFAISVAIVAEPLYDRLDERLDSSHPWWAAAATTAVVFAAVLALLVPFFLVFYRRRGDAVDFLTSLPETLVVGVGEFQYVLDTGQTLDAAAALLSGVALDVARASPKLALKLTLFAVVLFALLLRQRQVARALLAAVPPDHREVALVLAARLRGTLVALYVLQAATATATFAIALVVFWGLGYEVPLLLALLAGLLQFLPIVGPSVLVGGLALFELAVGDVRAAFLVATLGGLFVAWLPDVLVRPPLARRTARLPGSLYFIGFTGGLLTVGPIGIIAGPVVVALLLEALTLLAEESDVPVEESLVEGPSQD